MSRYAIVPEESVAWIEARSSLHPIHSETRGLEGYFEAELSDGPLLDTSAPIRGRVELVVERLSSGNPLYDKEMKRRIDARRHPAIVGELTEMKDSEEPGSYSAEGDVTFKGVTRRIQDQMTVTSPCEGTLCLEGEHTFDVRQFGMDPPKILMLKVHPEVSVRVRIFAEKES